MNFKSTMFAVSLFAAATVLPVQATVIDFEDVGFVPCTTATIVSRAYAFSGNDFFQCVAPAGLPTPNANNGSSFLVEGSSLLTISHPEGVRFDFHSVDLGTSFFNETSPNLLRVTGHRFDRSIVTRVLLVSDRFETFAVTGFTDLVSLSFSGLLLPDVNGSPGYYALDNLVVIPLPGTIPLALLGLGALVAARRVRRIDTQKTPVL